MVTFEKKKNRGRGGGNFIFTFSNFLKNTFLFFVFLKNSFEKNKKIK